MRGLTSLTITALLLHPAACSGDDTTRHRATLEGGDPIAGEGAPDDGGGASGDASGPTARLTADMAEPYFAEGDAAAAAKAFRLEQWKAARDGFQKIAGDEDRPPEQRARARVLVATAQGHLGAWKDAAEGFASAAETLPLIADYLHYHAARAHYFAKDVAAAREHAAKVTPGSIVGDDAALLLGDILRGEGDDAAIAAHYAAYLDDRPDGIRRAEARYRLARALDAQGKTDEAVPHYRRVAVASPLSRWGEQADERLEEIAGSLPDAEAAKLRALDGDELIERGMAYYRNMRNPLAEADFEAALQTGTLDADQRCVAAYHRANSAFKARERPRAAPLFDEAFEACQEADNADLQVKSSYQAGRSYAYDGQRELAIERYARAETIDPSHTYNDDARLRQAEEWERLNEPEKVEKALASIPGAYPDGDMRAEAMWRLAWRAYREGDYRAAVEWLEKQIEVKPIDDNWWAEGQAQYWLGRTWAHLGDTEKSIASYTSAVKTYPLSYYALLALNRLRESHPERYEALVAEIARPPAKTVDDPFDFPPRPVFAEPGFARALEFLRLGLGWAAEAELRRLGMTAPPGKDVVEDPDEIEKLWAMAFLYHRAHRYETSHWVTRWHIVDYKRSWPVGPVRGKWEIAYPPGYERLLTRWANKRGFPPEMLQAIVREESAFDPLLESYANAVGLSQMIYPTAKRFSEGTSVRIDKRVWRDNLRVPENNIEVGSNFLAFLYRKWDDHPMLIPPSYNAGEGAVARWLRARGDWPADEWVEGIRVDQPRGYTKRVLATYFVYSYMKDGTVPAAPNAIPKKLIPGRR